MTFVFAFDPSVSTKKRIRKYYSVAIIIMVTIKQVFYKPSISLSAIKNEEIGPS